MKIDTHEIIENLGLTPEFAENPESNIEVWGQLRDKLKALSDEEITDVALEATKLGKMGFFCIFANLDSERGSIMRDNKSLRTHLTALVKGAQNSGIMDLEKKLDLMLAEAKFLKENVFSDTLLSDFWKDAERNKSTYFALRKHIANMNEEQAQRLVAANSDLDKFIIIQRAIMHKFATKEWALELYRKFDAKKNGYTMGAADSGFKTRCMIEERFDEEFNKQNL